MFIYKYNKWKILDIIRQTFYSALERMMTNIGGLRQWKKKNIKTIVISVMLYKTFSKKQNPDRENFFQLALQVNAVYFRLYISYFPFIPITQWQKLDEFSVSIIVLIYIPGSKIMQGRSNLSTTIVCIETTSEINRWKY